MRLGRAVGAMYVRSLAVHPARRPLAVHPARRGILDGRRGSGAPARAGGPAWTAELC